MKKENKILIKKIVSLFICFSLILGIFVPNIVNANDKITIDLKTQPKLDIVLTIENSNLDLNNFKNDILTSI